MMETKVRSLGICILDNLHLGDVIVRAAAATVAAVVAATAGLLAAARLVHAQHNGEDEISSAGEGATGKEDLATQQEVTLDVVAGVVQGVAVVEGHHSGHLCAWEVGHSNTLQMSVRS